MWSLVGPNSKRPRGNCGRWCKTTVLARAFQFNTGDCVLRPRSLSITQSSFVDAPSSYPDLEDPGSCDFGETVVAFLKKSRGICLGHCPPSPDSQTNPDFYPINSAIALAHPHLQRLYNLLHSAVPGLYPRRPQNLSWHH